MAHEVRFEPEAEADLAGIYDWVRDRSGSPVIAQAYVRRILAHCLTLSDFPRRGTKRDDIRPGLRTMRFEKRATIAFLVDERGVAILRILDAGRNLRALGKPLG